MGNVQQEEDESSDSSASDDMDSEVSKQVEKKNNLPNTEEAEDSINVILSDRKTDHGNSRRKSSKTRKKKFDRI